MFDMHMHLLCLCIDQGDNVALLPRFSRSRCRCCAWWWWTWITSSSQTSLPDDVTPAVPPFNHPISLPHTPPTWLDEARQSYHLIGYFIRHPQRLKQSCVLMRESLRLERVCHSLKATSYAYTCVRRAFIDCSDTLRPNQHIISFRHFINSISASATTRVLRS